MTKFSAIIEKNEDGYFVAAVIDFIIKAKISCYAAGGEKQERKFEDGSLGFEFSANGYRYIDRYYGFNPFSGTEHVYDDVGALIWKMNYFGEVLSTTADPKRIYSFLREAMALITPEYPYRGPSELKKDNLSYQNKQNGTLESFYGLETIHDGDEKVYYLYYHGGKMVRNT